MLLSVLQNSGRNMLQRVGATVLEALSQRTTAWCEGMERRPLTCEQSEMGFRGAEGPIDFVEHGHEGIFR